MAAVPRGHGGEAAGVAGDGYPVDAFGSATEAWRGHVVEDFSAMSDHGLPTGDDEPDITIHEGGDVSLAGDWQSLDDVDVTNVTFQLDERGFVKPQDAKERPA